MSAKRSGGCKCRSRRGRKKNPYRSPEQAADAIERYGLVNAEVYPCPAPGDRWHLRHAKKSAPVRGTEQHTTQEERHA